MVDDSVLRGRSDRPRGPRAATVRAGARGVATALGLTATLTLTTLTLTTLTAPTASAETGSGTRTRHGPDHGRAHPAWARDLPDPAAAAQTALARLDRLPQRAVDPSGTPPGRPLTDPVRLAAVRDVDGRPVITTTELASPDEARRAVRLSLDDPEVLSVSVVTPVHAADDPGDPYASQQWALDRLGAAELWQAQSGAGVVVGVVDTGVQGAHPDLAGVVLPGTDLINPGSDGRVDPAGHGTHVAGIIAATAGNGVGGAGLGQGLRILPVRVLDGTGAGTDADLANGIIWAVDHGARVVNLSIGSAEYSPPQAAAITYALDRDAVVISAAGNERQFGDPVMYPAAFPGVVAVAATTAGDMTTSFSSSGPYVSLAAPGSGIVSTYPPDGYRSMSGTSMAAPFVSATAALARAAAPRLSRAQIVTALLGTAHDIEDAGRDPLSGYGLVQPLAAVQRARDLARPVQVPPGGLGTNRVPAALAVYSAPGRAIVGTTTTATFTLTARGRPVAGARVTTCVTIAPARFPTCRSQLTGTAGRVTVSARVTGHATITARFAGSSATYGAMARPVLVTALPRTTLLAGRGTLTFGVSPVRAGCRLGVLRQVGTAWRTVRTVRLPASGQLVVRALPHGTYRIAVPATDRTAAAVTSARTI